MIDARTGCPERPLLEAEREEEITCGECDEAKGLIVYNGKRYCPAHWNAFLLKTAGEEEKRAFIQKNIDLWCDFAAETLKKDRLDCIPPILLDCLREMTGNYFEENFCAEWAKDEFICYLKASYSAFLEEMGDENGA